MALFNWKKEDEEYDAGMRRDAEMETKFDPLHHSRPARPSYRHLYLVDFENVHDEGLLGIDRLDSRDRVVIFFGSQIKSIAFESHMAVMASRARIENLKTTKTAKNYLDFQLTTYLGYLIGQEHYEAVFVISKDTGFDSVVDFWQENGVTIARQIAIDSEIEELTVTKKSTKKRTSSKSTSKKTSSAKKSTTSKTSKSADADTKKKTAAKGSKALDPPEATRKKLRTALRDLKLASSNYCVIYKAFVSNDDKLALNNAMQKSFGTRGGDIYNAIKDTFVEYHAGKE